MSTPSQLTYQLTPREKIIPCFYSLETHMHMRYMSKVGRSRDTTVEICVLF